MRNLGSKFYATQPAMVDILRGGELAPVHDAAVVTGVVQSCWAVAHRPRWGPEVVALTYSLGGGADPVLEIRTKRNSDKLTVLVDGKLTPLKDVLASAETCKMAALGTVPCSIDEALGLAPAKEAVETAYTRFLTAPCRSVVRAPLPKALADRANTMIHAARNGSTTFPSALEMTLDLDALLGGYDFDTSAAEAAAAAVAAVTPAELPPPPKRRSAASAAATAVPPPLPKGEAQRMFDEAFGVYQQVILPTGAVTPGCAMAAECVGAGAIAYRCSEGHAVCTCCLKATLGAYTAALDKLMTDGAARTFPKLPQLRCLAPGCNQALVPHTLFCEFGKRDEVRADQPIYDALHAADDARDRFRRCKAV